MSSRFTKTLAAVTISAALTGVALSPAAQAAPAAQPVADSGSSSGSSSGSAELLLMPRSIIYLLLCGIYGGSEPDTRPLCVALNSGSSKN
ncbi:hypothetical protein [Nocardia huaxiensis]|uniref:Uncharacterized protein n=1 Tax=Nocardia huaxiensis TaxID=2755382 RepID=A0A7D6VBB3_9NOCA|nr:hypothetical protein [Nocardia huaxiensis]QLY32332.1 hypothetical protein H0264_08780 [Nocardia huaxiensis]UFS93962.1 hypothetical protein LPY97_24640 [Nocardia huaxiensis]